MLLKKTFCKSSSIYSLNHSFKNMSSKNLPFKANMCTSSISSFFKSPASKEYGAGQFFESIKDHKKVINISGIPHFLSNEVALKKLLFAIDANTQTNYLMEHFTHWLSRFFIKYLEVEDFENIKNKICVHTTQSLYKYS